jgi:hypothetical protein
VLDLLEQKIDGAMFTLMHALGEAQGDTIVSVHRMLHCSAVQSCGTSSARRLRPKAELGRPFGIDVYSILFRMERDKICPTRSVTGCKREHVPRN